MNSYLTSTETALLQILICGTTITHTNMVESGLYPAWRQKQLLLLLYNVIISNFRFSIDMTLYDKLLSNVQHFSTTSITLQEMVSSLFSTEWSKSGFHIAHNMGIEITTLKMQFSFGE